MRHAPHHIRACLEGGLHQLVGARVAQQTLLREGNGLHRGDIGAIRGSGHHAFERDQPADGVDVHVRAQACRAEPDRVLDHRTCARPHVFHRVAPLPLVDGRDGAAQGPVVLAQLVADQDLIEVNMAVYKAGQDQLA